MRPIPVPDDILASWQQVSPAAYRSVLAAPSGDLTDPDVGALEVVWHPARVGDIGVIAASSYWVLDAADPRLDLLGMGLAVVRLTVYGGAHPPVALAVVERR